MNFPVNRMRARVCVSVFLCCLISRKRCGQSLNIPVGKYISSCLQKWPSSIRGTLRVIRAFIKDKRRGKRKRERGRVRDYPDKQVHANSTVTLLLAATNLLKVTLRFTYYI